MKLFTKEDLKRITGPQPSPCVSIFIPTEKKGKSIQQNAIRFKNMLSEAEDRLEKRGIKKKDIQNMLEPAQKLLNDNYFWRYQSHGLAVFINPDFFEYYRLPLDFDELLVIADQFHIKPLLALFTGDGTFYILALSQNTVKFFQATRYDIQEIKLEELPKNMEEALGYDNLEKQIQFHTGAPQRVGKREAMFHGHGGKPDTSEEFFLRFLRLVDKAVYSVLKEERAPLILAAVDYLVPLYHETNSYSYVLEETIKGNPDQIKPEKLHKEGWKIVEPIFLREQKKAAELFDRLVKDEKASYRLNKIVSAAYFGKVATLFVTVGVQNWGTFDPDKNKVSQNPEKKPHDMDLLDFAALHTLLNGGIVYAVDQEKVPGRTEVAAIFRY